MSTVTWVLFTVALVHVTTGSPIEETSSASSLTKPICFQVNLLDFSQDFIRKLKDLIVTWNFTVNVNELLQALEDFLVSLLTKSDKPVVLADGEYRVARWKRQEKPASTQSTQSQWWETLKEFVLITIKIVRETLGRLFSSRKRRALDGMVGPQMEQKMAEIAEPMLAILKMAQEGNSNEKVLQQLEQVIEDFKVKLRLAMSNQNNPEICPEF